MQLELMLLLERDAQASWTAPAAARELRAPPAWVEAYITRNIVAEDPVLLASHRTSVGFKWEDVPKLIKVTSKHRKITEDTVAPASPTASPCRRMCRAKPMARATSRWGSAARCRKKICRWRI